MLLPYTTLTYYGSAAAALVADSGLGDMPQATPVQRVRAALAAAGLGDAPQLRPYRMRDAGCSGAGLGELLTGTARKSVRAGLEVLVSSLSADDVTGAVLEAAVEDGMSVKQALRLLLSVAVGKTTITDLGGGSAEVVFRDVNDTKDRVTASMTGSERSSVDVDKT